MTDKEAMIHAAGDVKAVLAAHDPNFPQMREVAEAVALTALRFGREPEKLAAELVERLKDPLQAPEGLRADIAFSPSRRTYYWNLWKETRQSRRDNARRMAAIARRPVSMMNHR